MIKSALRLLSFSLLFCCILYPLTLWLIAQTIFPHKANGSLLYSNNKPVGSSLIAQPFQDPAHFHPRPSASNYTLSASSALAASNPLFRCKVAARLGPIASYLDGTPVAPDIINWIHASPNLTATWARQYPFMALDWVINHPTLYAGPTPPTTHSAIAYFQNNLPPDAEIPSLFFDLWRQAHQDTPLTQVPADQVTTSASGLDPHITLQNALNQLPRVAAALTPPMTESELTTILYQHTSAPWHGLAGDPIVNVLELNLAVALKRNYK